MADVELVRLVRNGNSTQLSVPKPLLEFLGWSCGDSIMLVPNEDRTLLVVRLSREDLLQLKQKALAPEPEPAVHP